MHPPSTTAKNKIICRKKKKKKKTLYIYLGSFKVWNCCGIFQLKKNPNFKSTKAHTWTKYNRNHCKALSKGWGKKKNH
jgi:hypothetical protein